jgi:hypothetical protein
MTTPREFLAAYHEARRPLSCEIDVQPWNCEFWPYREIDELNAGYKVSTYAPGYLGFASSGGGEMYAFGPSGEIVCLAFVGVARRSPGDRQGLAELRVDAEADPSNLRWSGR